jgi:hypothetical protein
LGLLSFAMLSIISTVLSAFGSAGNYLPLTPDRSKYNRKFTVEWVKQAVNTGAQIVIKEAWLQRNRLHNVFDHRQVAIRTNSSTLDRYQYNTRKCWTHIAQHIIQQQMFTVYQMELLTEQLRPRGAPSIQFVEAGCRLTAV